MHAGLGHNSRAFGEDEPLPPKAERIVSADRARHLLIAARQVSTLFKTPKNRILEKRKGGEDGRALRRFLIYYARGLGSPVWECAEIFDLNRKQIGQEEASYLDMLARNPELEEDVEHMTGMCDCAVKVQTGRFITVSLSEMQAEAAMKKAIKVAREAADMLAAKAPPPTRQKPRTEADRIQAEANARRRVEWLEGQIRIAQAVIIRGGQPTATKQERADAKREIVKLDGLTAELRALAPKRRKAA